MSFEEEVARQRAEIRAQMPMPKPQSSAFLAVVLLLVAVLGLVVVFANWKQITTPLPYPKDGPIQVQRVSPADRLLAECAGRHPFSGPFSENARKCYEEVRHKMGDDE